MMDTKQNQGIEHFKIRPDIGYRANDHGRKFHQVKRMFEAVGKRVVYLKRLSMGSLQLDEELELGEYRELTAEELEQLKAGQPAE